jgi:hypothetical protein
MFSDPQTVTVNAVPKVMPRVSQQGTSSIYQLSDETFKLSVSHQKAGKDRVRSVVRIDERAVVPDPLTSVNDYETLSFYVVIDRPAVGFTDTQVNNLVAGLKTWLDATAVGKLFGQES